MEAQYRPMPVRVLAIDDDEDTLRVYRHALYPEAPEPDESPAPCVSRAFELVLCRQGGEAIERVRDSLAASRPFSAVFLDPRGGSGLNGLGTAEQIRALDPEIELVIVTTNSDCSPDEIAARVPPPHKLLYLKKPVLAAEIRQLATALSDKWEKERMLGQARRDLESRVVELKAAEETLRRSQQRYELVVRGANDGVWDWDLVTNRIYFSDRWREIVGLEEHEISDTPEAWHALIHPDDVVPFQTALKAHLSGPDDHFSHEHRILRRDGDPRWVACRALSVRDGEGRVVRIAGSMTDITERKRLEDRLLHEAYYDSLTGLANRSLFMDRLRWAIERSRRRQEYFFAVLYLDLDRFKVVNDSLGHAAGDKLLMTVSKRIQERLRTTDELARLGGDEFTILLDGISDLSDALRVADRIQYELARPIRLDGHEVVASASIGIVTSGGEHLTPDEVLRDADIAMYRAKAQGKARYEVFDAAMGARIRMRLQLETDLRHAIERRQFELYYQPIVSLGSGGIAGFEALLRWQHPERGLLPPADFVPLAEETGLILPIEEWVLAEACRQVRAWQKQFSLSPRLAIGVNLSSRHFAGHGLSDEIATLLRRMGVDGSRLKLEVTESALVENPASAVGTLAQLHALSVAVQIGGFGTGYSSLSYLHQLPLDALKIDRSFIGRMCADRNSREIVQTIALLAHALGIDLVAEGIESEEQAHQLRAMGCQYGQGYFFHRPVPPDAATRLLEQAPKL